MQAKQLTQGRILVVDDQESICQMLCQWLEGEGYAAQSATDFATLRRLMSEQTFDLVTLDVKMPGVGGLEVLDWLAHCHPETAAIMATVHDDLDTVIGAMRKGAIGYLFKPFKLDLIAQELDRAMERQRLIAENRAYQQELERRVAERTGQLQQAQARLEQQVRELEGRDRLVRLQMEPPADQPEADAAIVEVVAGVTGAGTVALWRPDAGGEYLEKVAVGEPAVPGNSATKAGAGEKGRGAIQAPEGERERWPIRGCGELPARVFRERRPGVGGPGEVAVPVLYRTTALGVIQVAGMPKEERGIEGLWRLGQEAALLLRMVQMAQALEQGAGEFAALLGTETRS